jgi:hypothetical protein
MKIRKFVTIVALLFLAPHAALADRQLDRVEIVQILRSLTDRPRKTWVATGTIKATHHQYASSDESVVDSTVTARINGDRFYWEITLDSYTTQGRPSRGKSSPGRFDANGNKRRVFAWDGQRYTMYFRPSHNVIVMEDPTDFPVAINGPLTAGLVPWGYGVYTLESLMEAESSAIEVEDGGKNQIHLTLKIPDVPELAFVLDPTKEHAVLSFSSYYEGQPTVVKSCQDFELVSGRWIPTTIVVERYNVTKDPPELLSRDQWDLFSVSTTVPGPGSFNVAYENGARVEVHSAVTARPQSYRYSDTIDTESLLVERLAVAAGRNENQNCATVAMKYVATQLGQNVNDSQLAALIDGPDKGTSLFKLRQFARQLGFHCLTVRTDVQGLKRLSGDCKAILHLPGPNHYVVLEAVNDKYVWITDLDSSKFHYRKKLDDFDLDWSKDAALLVANEPIGWQTAFTPIADSELQEIAGGLPDYSCTDLIQNYRIIQCPAMRFGICLGSYRQFWARYGCEEDEAGGSCTTTNPPLPGNTECPCIEDIDNPSFCEVNDNWRTQYIRACD